MRVALLVRAAFVGAAVVLSMETAHGDMAASLPQGPFDLAVENMSVTQVSSTAMFRTVEIGCDVVNKGPNASNAKAWLLISRTDGPKTLKVVPIPEPFEAGERIHAQAELRLVRREDHLSVRNRIRRTVAERRHQRFERFRPGDVPEELSVRRVDRSRAERGRARARTPGGADRRIECLLPS